MDGKKRPKKLIAMTKPEAAPPAKSALDPEVFIAMKTLTTEPPCKVVDLSEKGPVLLLRSRKAPGLLITHESGPDSITLVSLASGQGLTLSRDAARLPGSVLADWAGPEESSVTSYVAREDRWELAK